MAHVAITGASRGIGAGLARAFAAEGHDLTLVARDRRALEALAGDLAHGGRNVHIATVALDDLDACTGWIADAEAALGPIEVLVNNAGRQVVGPSESVPGGEAALVLDLLSPLRIAHHLAPGMLARGSGTIVNMASLAAVWWLPGMVHYNAAKSGMAAWGESVRAEWLPRGVNVLTVYPGPVRTEMGESGAGAYGQTWIPMGTVDGLARAVLRAAKCRSKRVIYPAYYWPSWFVPNLARWLASVLTPKPGTGDSEPPAR